MRSLRSAAVTETERHTSADTASIIFDPSINGQLDTPGRFDAVAPRVQDIDKFVHMAPSHHSGAEVLSSGAAVVASARIINAAARHKVGIVPVLDLLVKQQ